MTHAALDRHGLDRADRVERDARGADDRTAGLEGELRHGHAVLAASVRDGRDDAPRDLLDRGGLVDGGVGDAEAAAQVQFGNGGGLRELRVHGEQSLGRLGEARGVEDLRADVAVQAEELERGVRADSGAEFDGAGERHTELLVFVRGREELVRRGVHAAVDAEPHGLHPAGARRGIRDPIDLDLAVDDDHADAHGDAALDLGERLVVAVEADAGRVGARCERDGEFAAGAHVDREALVGHPAHDRPGEERLAGVIDGHSRADGCRGVVERPLRAGGPCPCLGLVDDVERSAELCGERGRVAAGDHEPAGLIARGGRRPDERRERVGVVGHAELTGGGCGGCHGGTSRTKDDCMDRSRRANPDRFLKPAVRVDLVGRRTASLPRRACRAESARRAPRTAEPGVGSAARRCRAGSTRTCPSARGSRSRARDRRPGAGSRRHRAPPRSTRAARPRAAGRRCRSRAGRRRGGAR